MRKFWTRLSTIAVVGLIGGGWTSGVRAHARETHLGSSRTAPPTLRPMSPHVQQQQPGGSADQASPAALFKQYCVGCHNERMKGSYGNLSLENIDAADTTGHVETLEKVVRKLRKGLMPPEGRPKPDAATLEAFVASLESSLDRAAEHQPNPGRVVSRRLNRTEYVNAIYDLLGLEVNGSELLPSDMAGFGFDNNGHLSRR